MASTTVTRLDGTPATPEEAAAVKATTPTGDAKQQEREAKRAALAAKKADIASKAAAAQAKATTPAAPEQGAVGAAVTPPSPPEATPAPKAATPRDRLQELLVTATTVKQFRTGIEAIMADMAKPKPARPGGGNGATSTKAAELETAMLKAMASATEAEPITLQDTMRALIPSGLVSSMTDARPYNAMRRMASDGRVLVVKTTAPKAYRVAK